MRISMVVSLAALLAAPPAFAQSERGYITGVGGFTNAASATSADVFAEGGVRVAPHLSVFGDLGKFHNLAPSNEQTSIDSTVATLSADQGLSVLGTARVPAWYSIGGVRWSATPHGRVAPYVLGGVGFARLKPSAQFTFSSGVLPDGTTPAAGDDVTSALETAGDFTAPAAVTKAMFTLGGGVEIPVARHWGVDAGYRYSRVATDTPLNAQGLVFGLGYRF